MSTTLTAVTTKVMSSVTNDDIPCLIIPVMSKQLLLPTMSVAEMLPYKAPQRKAEYNDFPSWFLGDVIWRGVPVPMISYEIISGLEAPEITMNSQMAVLNDTGVSDQLPFLCMPATGIPRLSRVSANLIKENPHNSSLASYDEMNVIVNDMELSIPDVSRLQKTVVELLGL